ncbi:MAG: hypothetical protein ACXWO3_04660 [Isosphaeraceae bacterium]
MLTSPRKPFARFLLAELLVLLALPAARGRQSEPPALNPFGSRAEREDQKRDDAVPGFVEMSNGTLQNGQKIEGTLSGIVYVRADPAAEPERYLLHKRDKGDPGTDLKSLVYVRSIQLGAKALEEGKRKAAGPASQKASAASGRGRS